MRDLGRGGHVLEAAVEVRCLHDQRRRLWADELPCRREVGDPVGRRDIAEPDTRALAVRGGDALVERVHGAREDDLPPLGDRVGHQRGLGERRGAIVDRCVGDVHARQLGDHCLILVDRPERPLAGFRLVRRVCREELAAQDHVVDRARDVVVVRARAQERHVRFRVSVAARQCHHVADQVRLGERRCQTERPREPGFGRDLDQQVLERAGADHAEHLLLLVRRVGDVARGHQWPPCAISSSYCCAVRSWSHSPLLEGLTTSIHPLP